METIEVINYRGYEIKTYQSECIESPREWDNLGTIAYKSKYILGDEPIDDPIEWLINKLDLTEEYVHNRAGKMGFPNYTQGVLEMLENMFFERFIALPLYLYDHSGITISTHPFSCRWDSGKVGYIYISYERIRKEYSVKRVTKKLRKQVREYLKGEVKTLDQYLTGDVYGYVSEVDGCNGFFGEEGYKQMLEEARGEIDCQVQHDMEKHFDQVKRYIKNRVPLEKRQAFAV